MSNEPKKDSTFIPMPDMAGKKGFSKPLKSTSPSPSTPSKGSAPTNSENERHKGFYKDLVTDPNRITLPQPFILDGKEIKHVIIQEITGAVEEEYNSPQNKENIGRFLTTVIAACVVQIGDDFSKADYKSKEWKSFFMTMPMSDREFLLYAIYVLCKGAEIELTEVICPTCKSKGFVASVLELETTYYDAPVGEFTFDLVKGCTVGGITYKTVTASLPDGLAQEKIIPVAQTGAAKADSVLFSMCIKKIKNVDANREMPFNIDVARLLTKADRDVISVKIGEKMPGIRGVAGLECDCGQQFLAVANVYDFFIR